ncbi:hypothetical protein [Nocardia sp. N2S4-5]|uniref:hypothetical protein n=1 Tax=Nocardia sp. N2S4-5 TaxID=3351565 RepID=UPI0037CDB1AD
MVVARWKERLSWLRTLISAVVVVTRFWPHEAGNDTTGPMIVLTAEPVVQLLHSILGLIS